MTEELTAEPRCEHGNPPGCLACRAELTGTISHYEHSVRRAAALLAAAETAYAALRPVERTLDTARRHGDDGDLSREDHEDGQALLAAAAASLRNLRRLAGLHHELVSGDLAALQAEAAEADRG